MPVVIENALHPAATYVAIGTVGENGRVLDRNVDLIVIAVRDPAANLFRIRLARIQHHVEGVMDVIGAALLTQQRGEFLFAPRGIGHSTISMPSHATSIPRRVSSARS